MFHALNLDWSSISQMVIYRFQCYSLKSSHPRLLPLSPKVWSLHLCLLCCPACRIVSTVFLNFIYIRCCCLVIKSCPTLLYPWTVAHQASLSMGFPGQEYLRGLPCPPPGDLPVPGIQTHICIAGGFFTTEPPRKPICFAKPH